MNVLVSYDIQDDTLRTKVARYLLVCGLIRLQYSVFVGNISDSASRRMGAELQAFAQKKKWSDKDSILLLPLHQYSEERMMIVGDSPQGFDDMLNPPHTLML